MIWNIPIIVVHMINNFDYMNSIVALLWCKLFIVLITIATSFIIRNLIKTYVEDKRIINLGQLLFLASSCVVIPTMVACQYDIIALLFILIGIYAFIKNNNKLFTVMFMIATPLKMFSLFIFIPLLLIKEKRVPFIMLNTVFVFLIQIIFQIPFMNDPWYEMCIDSQNRDAIQLIHDSNIQIFQLQISLFIMCFIATCVYAYKTQENEESIIYKKIFIASLSIASFILFVKIRSYWIILIIPFLIMIAFFNKKYLIINMILFIIGTACYTVYSFIEHWIYSTEKLITKLVLPLIVRIPNYSELRYGSIQNFFEYYDLTKYKSILFSAFIVSAIIMFIINNPISKNKDNNQIEYKNWYIYSQILITFSLLFLLIYANFNSNGECVYYMTEETSYTESNIFNNNIIKQSFEVKEKNKINEIHFKVKNNNSFRESRSALKVTIDNGEKIVMEKILGVYNIANDKENIIKFKEIKIEPGRKYTVNIEPIRGREKDNPEVYFEITKKLQMEKYPLYINEKSQKSNLAISIK